MGKKVLFLDSVKSDDENYNITYGVDDINAIVRNLTGAGVSIFPSGETFNVSDLNSITEAMVSEGVSFEGLKVSLMGGKIHIAQGIGFFENGATVSVDAEGVDIEYNVAETVYVYAEYDSTLNVCDFYTSESAPVETEGIYRLILATIEADGTVTDRRIIATSKVASMGKNFKRTVVVKEDDDTGAQYSSGEIVYEFNELTELDISKLNGVRFTGCIRAASYSFVVDKNIDSLLNEADGDTVIYSSGGSAGTAGHCIGIRYSGGKFQIVVPPIQSSTYSWYYRCTLYYLTVTFY